MSGNQFFQDDITTVYTDQRYDLGIERQLTNEELNAWTGGTGEAKAVFVWNEPTAAVNWTAGHIIGHRDGQQWQGVLAPANSAVTRCIGVAQHAIDAGEYGWVLRKGIGSVQSSAANITINTDIIVSAAAGQGTDLAAAIDGNAIGFAVVGAAGAGALATAKIAIP